MLTNLRQTHTRVHGVLRVHGEIRYNLIEENFFFNTYNTSETFPKGPK
jgi:hypothetical protein